MELPTRVIVLGCSLSLCIQFIELGKVLWHNEVKSDLVTVSWALHVLGLSGLCVLGLVFGSNPFQVAGASALTFAGFIQSVQTFDQRGNWWKWHTYSFLSSWPLQLIVLWELLPLYSGQLNKSNIIIWGLNGLFATIWWAKYGRTSKWRRIYKKIGLL